jgi:signal peptidase I
MAKPRKEKSALRENVESIVIAIILAVIMRQFVVQAFKIPSGSMEETLQIGDHILVNKFLYHFSSPKLSDVIVFRYPWEDKRDFIKRIVALPGDVVEIRDDQVFVNGAPLQEPYVAPDARRTRSYHFGPLRVPQAGDKVEVRADERLYINGEPVAIPNGLFQPDDHGPPLSGFQTFYRTLFPNQSVALNHPVRPFTVDQDYYFTLGDNRNNSKDSRYWGFVKSDRIKGKAFFIYWSWDCQARKFSQHLRCATNFAQHVRWDRLGLLLNLTPSSHAVLRE